MPHIIKICLGCQKEFLAKHGLKKYCVRSCARVTRRVYGRSFSATFSPERRRASALVREALTKGALTRQPCEACGVARTDAHHDDYSEPLNVRWLCRPHHRAHHTSNGPGKNAFI